MVVRRELGSLGRDSLEDVGDERVEDGHGLVAAVSARASSAVRDISRDTGVGVDLLEDLVDVRRVRLDSLLRSLLSTVFGGSGGLLQDVRGRCLELNTKLTLAGALDAAGALEACEAGALDAVTLGGMLIVMFYWVV